MLKATLVAGGLALLTANKVPASSEPNRVADDLEPTLNGAVSASALFASKETEASFEGYLDWTKSNGLGRLAAFETTEETLVRAPPGEGSQSEHFPTQAMEDQCKVSLTWVDETDAGLFHPFRVTNFD